MKKLFAALFIVGSIATLHADYNCPSQGYDYYSSQYGYDANSQLPYDYQAPAYGYQYQGQPGYDVRREYRAGDQYRADMYRGDQYRGQAYSNDALRNDMRNQPSQGYSSNALSRPYSNDALSRPYGQNDASRHNMSSQYSGQASQSYSGSRAEKTTRYGSDAAAPQAQGSDQRLTSDIRDSLRSRFSDKFNNVNVSVNNGRVVLSGSVASQEDKADLEDKVRDYDGVTSVDNQVTVQPKADEKSSSRWGWGSDDHSNRYDNDDSNDSGKYGYGTKYDTNAGRYGYGNP